MQLSDVPGEFGGLYTRSEYDDIRLGAFRPVRSYCPVRHAWVTDYAAPILAAVVGDGDEDAALRRERLPTDGVPTPREEIMAAMGDRVLSLMEVVRLTGKSHQMVTRYLSDRRTFEVAGERPNPDPRSRRMRPTIQLYRVKANPEVIGRWSQPAHDRKRRRRVEILTVHIAEHGDVWVKDAAAMLGIDATTVRDLAEWSDTLVTYRRKTRMYVTVAQP